jgi:hypothetical protein
MKNFARVAVLAAAVTAVAAPAAAQVAANPVGRARVNIIKPLSLAAEQDLHFGNVIVWDAGTVDIDRLTGNITCPAVLECDPAGTVAQYRVRGTNGYTVTVNTSASLLSNGGPVDLTFTPSGPGTVALTNSGQVGVVFNVGGAVAIPANATAGLYVGDMDVTVNY